MNHPPMRCNGAINSTDHTRIRRVCCVLRTCAASSSTCIPMTAASSVSDFCREGIAIMREPKASLLAPRLVDRDQSQQSEITQHLARAKHNRRQWIVGDGYGESRLF